MQKTRKAPSKKDLRVFALIVAGGFLLIGWGIPALKNHPMNPYPVSVSAAVFILGMLVPNSLIKPREYWIKIGNVLGRINSTILFTLVFFLVFTPIALLFRLFGRDRLHTHFRSVKSTMVMKQEISPFNEPF
ncbi:SxtJ family membrane protein [Bacteriovorax sp. PP10]|uniref:SxtJ family membrane protein n=1 Tax=Bacteriovorax antarcticus TaxID=3088717 RepID=A0ABU5VTV9_9BACT|nr:SxtJ family membrane protein [Bacteriovorax sp. PP10]MEA9356367.1 SxtJ family membrane protein [Bacteriovorax sp. PP10]